VKGLHLLDLGAEPRNEAGSPFKGDIIPEPVYAYDKSVPETGQEVDVRGRPENPCGKSREAYPPEIDHRSFPPDRRKAPEMAIPEERGRSTAAKLCGDMSGSIDSLLFRGRGNPGNDLFCDARSPDGVVRGLPRRSRPITPSNTLPRKSCGSVIIWSRKPAPFMTDLALLYEHPAWFAPLFAALDRRGIDYVALKADGHFDPADHRAPAPVVFNRIAMSSFLRAPEHPIFHAMALLDHWRRTGARLINGPDVLAIDSSKARQLSLISGLGLAIPARAADG
jgi:hypothetical protein